MLISFGHIDLLPDIGILDRQKQNEAILAFIDDGYLELLKQHESLLSDNIVKNSLLTYIGNNHLDMLAFLHKTFPMIIKEKLTTYFNDPIESSNTYSVAEMVWQYLFNNQLITIDQIKKFLPKYLSIMKELNPDAYEYLMKIKNS